MMTPASYEHGRITANLSAVMTMFVNERDLGVIVAAETGFIVERTPDTVRAPDIGFIAASRAPAPGSTKGFGRVMPDLVVEVNSPDDRASEVLDKVRQWLAAGVKVVWVVDPPTRTVTVHDPPGEARVLEADDVLAAPDLLPGFTHPVAKVFM